MNGGIVYHRYAKREQFYFFDESSASVLKGFKFISSNEDEDFGYYEPILDYSNSKMDIDVLYRLENNIWENYYKLFYYQNLYIFENYSFMNLFIDIYIKLIMV